MRGNDEINPSENGYSCCQLEDLFKGNFAKQIKILLFEVEIICNLVHYSACEFFTPVGI